MAWCHSIGRAILAQNYINHMGSFCQQAYWKMEQGWYLFQSIFILTDLCKFVLAYISLCDSAVTCVKSKDIDL